MEMLLAPMDEHYSSHTTTVRLPSLFVNASNTGATSPLRLLGIRDVLNEQPAARAVSPMPMITRLPSIGSIMRRDMSPCSSPKCDHHAQTLSPIPKQSSMDIYRQLKNPSSPIRPRSENALKSILATTALSQLTEMNAASEYVMGDSSDNEAAYDIGDRSRRSNSAKLCGMQECKKRAKAGGYCIAHGGGLRCAEEGCMKHAVSLGLCISHGGGKRCTIDGCLNASRKNGVCWSHGGKRLCKLEGCNKGPKSGGYCWSHGGKMKK